MLKFAVFHFSSNAFYSDKAKKHAAPISSYELVQLKINICEKGETCFGAAVVIIFKKMSFAADEFQVRLCKNVCKWRNRKRKKIRKLERKERKLERKERKKK